MYTTKPEQIQKHATMWKNGSTGRAGKIFLSTYENPITYIDKYENPENQVRLST